MHGRHVAGPVAALSVPMGQTPAELVAHVAQPAVSVRAAVHPALDAPCVAKAPAGHAPVPSALVRPVPTHARPAEHGRHVVRPVAALNVPAGQSAAVHTTAEHVAQPTVDVYAAVHAAVVAPAVA